MKPARWRGSRSTRSFGRSAESWCTIPTWLSEEGARATRTLGRFRGQPSDWDFVLASPDPQKDRYWLQAWRADRKGKLHEALAALAAGARQLPDDHYWCQAVVDVALRKGEDDLMFSWFPRCEAEIVESRRRAALRSGRMGLRQDMLVAGGRALEPRRTWTLLDEVAGVYARRGDKAHALDLLEKALPRAEARRVLSDQTAK